MIDTIDVLTNMNNDFEKFKSKYDKEYKMNLWNNKKQKLIYNRIINFCFSFYNFTNLYRNHINNIPIVIINKKVGEKE